MENLSLYKITAGFVELMESEEISELDRQQIQEELAMLLERKSESIIGFTKNIELTIEAMKIEEKRIAENRKGLQIRREEEKEMFLGGI